MKESLVVPAGEGEFRVDPGCQEGHGTRQERYRAVLRTPDLLLLRKVEGPIESRARERVLMAGEIVTHTTVMEIINMISSSRWVGTLNVFGTEARHILGFYKGVLRHAHSDHPEDRLDKVLVRTGLVSPSQLEVVSRDLGTDRRFGELLVEKGLIQRRQLFDCLKEQMRAILLTAVLVEEGAYVFCVPEDEEPPPPAVAHIPLYQLLLDAAERVDRLASFRRLVPSLDTRPEVEAGVDVARLDSRSRLVLGHCDGERTLREIASETWLGRFETVATVYDLVRTGRARLRAPRRTATDTAQRLVQPFNETLREIYSLVDRHGDMKGLQQELRRWLAENPDGALLEAAFNGEGLCEPEALAESLIDTGTFHQIEALQHSLHELISFALFSGSRWLPREVERGLSRRVERRLKAIAL